MSCGTLEKANDPDTYKKIVDYTPHSDIEDIHKKWNKINDITKNYNHYKQFVRVLLEVNPRSPKQYTKGINLARRTVLKGRGLESPKNSDLLRVLKHCQEEAIKESARVNIGQFDVNKPIYIAGDEIIDKRPDNIFLDMERVHNLLSHLITKRQKTESGVAVITVLTSPYPMGQKFSCEWNCYYCPNEPDQPRSYLHDEPSVLRANYNKFDPVMQFTDRAYTLFMNGHVIDKVEILVLGGTWESYPAEYQESFIRDLFYAANTFNVATKREKYSLEIEQVLNEAALSKVINLTLETRPDTINPQSIQTLRRYGCTRVQLGLQHTDNKILKKINRQCTNEEAITSIKLLKDNCFKIDIHLMPNLPGSSVEMDRVMFDRVLMDEMMQCDQWKIYPCEVVPWTEIKKWFESGKFVPYPDNELIDLLMDIKAKVHPWIRLNRVIRDIPSQYILGGINEPSLRQVLQYNLTNRGTPCQCIRCREIKDRAFTESDTKLSVRTYVASLGIEHFISIETKDDRHIIGFLRLRLSSMAGVGVFEELEGCALIRELHVYGKMTSVSSSTTSATEKTHSYQRTQHVGFGKKMMYAAEQIALKNGFAKIAVISGVGVRNYYRKRGYKLINHTLNSSSTTSGQFQIKEFPKYKVAYYRLRNRLISVATPEQTPSCLPRHVILIILCVLIYQIISKH